MFLFEKEQQQTNKTEENTNKILISSEQEQTENKKNVCYFISAGYKKCSLEIEKIFTVVKEIQ